MADDDTAQVNELLGRETPDRKAKAGGKSKSEPRSKSGSPGGGLDLGTPT